ncbi:MAG: F0F1 ATP synthase subunit epsilon [Eubacteriales bacterium]|uniref:F0F1 ATP synthase subunit epsilon n=1 Tax=Fenollaria sp. TaxID=1965292 RepID=UPI002A75B944|nr:F0F1 ATP synthase subunit epsilon [Fenollaria sp.]MDD7339189.1 F0F1 ATP synthase subunit epsilon [Eubacteriales bacterium]MDY3106185.1 F0F1 ATP synthase subunit epsilon [Fenollaria sp.]
MNRLYLKVVTPDKLFFEGDIDMLVARTIEGDVGILLNHSPLVTILDIGRLVIKDGDERKIAACAGGYIDVRNNNITVVSDACEWEEEIDINRAERAKERASKRLEDKGTDTFKAELALKKAINRINVGNKNY